MSSTKNLELKQTAFLSKSNSAFIEEMYMKFVNNDPTLPDSWKNYFNEIGDEFDVIVKEINGPSWSPSKKFYINQSLAENNKDNLASELDLIKSNANSIIYASRIPPRPIGGQRLGTEWNGIDLKGMKLCAYNYYQTVPKIVTLGLPKSVNLPGAPEFASGSTLSSKLGCHGSSGRPLEH